MGQLVGSRVVQSRIWLTGEVESTPPYDYEHAFPITIYEAVRRTEDDHSSTLLDEINSIYRMINDKQDIVDAGVNGRIMTWTGVRGQIGSMEVVRSIASDIISRSHGKVPSERAVGDALDSKVSLSNFNKHTGNTTIHVTDDEREVWNSKASGEDLNNHIRNSNIHITATDKSRWDGKAEAADLTKHVTNTDNPHNVTAHQIGTYTRKEIDDLFSNLRQSFFNYKNIVWDSRSMIATLEDYDEDNWNPNFILEFGDALPEVDDPATTYFALIPNTDSKTNETQDCVIWVKRPGMNWQETGLQAMEPGDLVIQYPEALMYVWVQGKFTKLFSVSESNNGTIVPTPSDPSEGTVSDLLWKPVMNDAGELSWVLAKYTDSPETMVIRGYTPQKGVDYFDGQDGQGVSTGGLTHDLLIKSSDEDFDTEWKDFLSVLQDFVDRSGIIPKGGVIWENITGTPESYNELGQNIDGFMTQKAVTDAINSILDKLQAILDTGDVTAIQSSLENHLRDYQNPHRVTPDQIGAVSTSTFIIHTQNFDNPHLVTAEQLGLGKVNNTADMDKPISNQQQDEFDRIWDYIRNINTGSGPSGDGCDCDGSTKLPDDFSWVKDVKFVNNEIQFYYGDGNQFNVHLPEPVINNPVTKIFASVRFDYETKELIVEQEDGSEERFSLASIVQVLSGSKGEVIDVNIDNENHIIATLVLDSVTSEHLKESINLRGNPTARTQDVSDKSTRLATTEFVKNTVIDDLDSYKVDQGLSANMGRILNKKKADIDDILALINDLEGIDIIDHLESTSPVAALSANMGRHLDLTKAPRVHTSPSGSTFGQASVDLFGHARSANVDPLMDGYVFRGTDNGYYAREDHRHPTDKSRAPMIWPDEFNGLYQMTGEPRADTPPDDSNDTRIATTEFVRRNGGGIMQGDCKSSGSSGLKIVNLHSTFMDEPVFFLRQIGSAVSVTFLNKDVSGKDVTMLDVNGTGAAEVHFAGDVLTNGMLGKSHTHLFVFDGEYWNLINPVPGTGMGSNGGITFGPGTKPDDDDPDNTDPDPDDTIEKHIINHNTGYHGMTMPGTGSVDENGQVNKAWVFMTFEPREIDVKITFSQHEAAWAFKMGDGSEVRAQNPVVIEHTKSSAVIEFTLEEFYPANSPLMLMYYTDYAWYNIEDVDHIHEDNNGDGRCDICNEVMPGHVHSDDNDDGRCDVCGDIMPGHIHHDDDNDGYCDQCGEFIPNHECVDDDFDGRCDICGKPVHECIDDNDDGFCDICGKEMFGFKDDPDYGNIINQNTGYHGITMPGDGPIDSHGRVKRAWIMIPFTPIESDFEVTLSQHKHAWAIKMGDGSIIRCRNAKVIDKTKSSVTVQLLMESYYASNSPVMFMYHTDKGWINIKEL